MSKHLAVLVAAGALLIGCTAGDDTASEDTAGGSATTVDSIAVPTGPAPGVTDDTVKVGVTYVDLASLGEVVNIDHGDYEVAYQALFDPAYAGEVALEVRDRGGRMPVDELAVSGSGYGLLGMRERAELLGGTLEAGPGEEGFVVRLRVPA